MLVGSGHAGIWQPPPGAIVDPQHDLGKGCVGWWDGGWTSGPHVHDRSQFANHGTMTNMVPADAIVAGQRGGKAVSLASNTTEHILMPYAPAMNSLTTEATLVLAGRWTGVSGGRGCGLVRYNSTLEKRIWSYRHTYGKVEGYFDDDGSTYNAAYMTTSGAVYALGDLFHIVATCQGGTIRLYADGQLVQTNNNGPASIDTSTNQFVHIGSSDAAAMSAITGSDIEVASFYSRALDGDEIRRLFRYPYAPIWTGPRFFVDLGAIRARQFNAQFNAGYNRGVN